MFLILTKTKYNEIINKLTILDNHQEIMWKKAHKWVDETEKRIYELEKIVKNQPLIKKYQKTLDIFLKNAQD